MPNAVEIWVCSCCLFAREGEGCQDNCDCATVTPWGLIDGDSSVESVACGGIGHEGCETRDFSWSRCEGCGSTLGGSRHLYTLFLR